MIAALVGPTATGKTQIAVAVAERLGMQIVCCDSMTIYRGMDIGTAKPGPDARERVAHHLLDIADPGERFTVARFQAQARAVMGDIERPLLVGGSGLYYQAVVDDLEIPPTDPDVRARLEAQQLDALAARLRDADPEALAFVDLANKRRVVRALEVIELTGERFSVLRPNWGSHPGAVRAAGLDLERDVMAERIRARASAMLEAGLLAETGRLLDAGFRDALTAGQAIGYAQAIELLEGRSTPEGFVDAVTTATLRLARRQRAWFRRDPRITWFDASRDDIEAQMLGYFNA